MIHHLNSCDDYKYNIDMSEKEIIYEIRDDKIAIIKLNKPKKLNALTFELFEEIERVINEV